MANVMDRMIDVTLSEESLTACNLAMAQGDARGPAMALTRGIVAWRLEIILRALRSADDSYFPKGKWATIQALELDLTK